MSRSAINTLALVMVAAAVMTSACSKSASEGSSSAPTAGQVLSQLGDLAKMSPELMAACMIAGTKQSSSLLGDTAQVLPPKDRADLADWAAGLAKEVSVPRLQNDYTLIAEEIRAHVNDATISSARMDAAIADIVAWEKESCLQGESKKTEQ